MVENTHSPRQTECSRHGVPAAAGTFPSRQLALHRQIIRQHRVIQVPQDAESIQGGENSLVGEPLRLA